MNELTTFYELPPSIPLKWVLLIGFYLVAIGFAVFTKIVLDYTNAVDETEEDSNEHINR